MGQRLDLHNILKTLLGSNNVYFQPPPNLKMEYPCIIYRRDSDDTTFSDNILYHRKIQYQVVYVDRNPDSIIPQKLAELPLSKFDRFYTSDNLNHDVYKIFF